MCVKGGRVEGPVYVLGSTEQVVNKLFTTDPYPWVRDLYLLTYRESEWEPHVSGYPLFIR